MARKIDLSNVYIGFETLYEYDPYINQEVMAGFKKSFLEDTGYYLASDSISASDKLKKMGINNTLIKTNRVFIDLLSGQRVNLGLDLESYPEKIIYDTPYSTIEQLVSVKEMVNEYFNKARISEYEENYFKYFCHIFKDKDKVDLDNIYNFIQELEELYCNYMAFIVQEKDEIYEEKDSEKEDNTPVIYMDRRR